jgi:hypothetical protein
VAVFLVATFFAAAFFAVGLVEAFLTADFLALAFLAVAALALAPVLGFLPPKIADQPSAYFSFVPTRVIVTLVTSMQTQEKELISKQVLASRLRT